MSVYHVYSTLLGSIQDKEKNEKIWFLPQGTYSIIFLTWKLPKLSCFFSIPNHMAFYICVILLTPVPN